MGKVRIIIQQEKMRRIKLFLIIASLLLFAACLGEEAKNAEMTIGTKVAEATGRYNASEITSAEFMEIYKQGGDYVLIDVRTEAEYRSGHIPGSINILYTELDKYIYGLGVSKDKKIILVCEAGVRSKKGANTLLNLGYSNIVDITDGMRGWRAIGGDIAFPGEETPVKDVVETETPRPLITAEELLNKNVSYRIVFLGNDNQYSNGHIPGALHVHPLRDLVELEADVPQMVLKQNDFEALMTSLGIENSDHIIAYDDQMDGKYAARFFWVLKYYGHDKASILDGGLGAWKKAGGDLTSDEPGIQPSQYIATNGDKSLIADLEEVNSKIKNPNIILIEATTIDEYERDGHIPGAILVEPEETLNPDGTIKKDSELSSLYTSKGVTKDKEVITYCHTGHRGAVIWFELKHLLNYPNVKLFDGSLEEWNKRNMPLEFGAITSTTIPFIETTTTTTVATTTTWTMDTEKAEKTQVYLEVEPTTVIDELTGTQTIQMDLWRSYKIDDSYIYLTGDMDGCVGIFWWTFNVYGDSPQGAIWEGKYTFMNERVRGNQDISGEIHGVSDALDNYRIVVKRWSEIEGLTVEITR